MSSGVLAAVTPLQSFWSDLFALGPEGDWGQSWWGKLVQVAIIVVVALVVRGIARTAIRIFVNRVVTGAKRRQRVDDTQALLASPVAAARTVQRTRTLGSVLNSIVSVVVVLVALLSIVTTINSNITGAFSLITAALGAGLGFGAQNVVKDVLTGLFMVADDQLGVGDIVQTDLATGIVEAVGIRVTQIRDVNGVLWYVRNGELTRVGNRSQGWSRAIVDITVPKRTADVETLQQRLLDAATKALASPQWRGSILEKPELWGLESVTADGLVLRITVRTNANLRDDVAWALRLHLHEELQAQGIEAGSISSDPLDHFEYAGQMRGVRPPRTSPVPLPRARRTTRTPASPRQDELAGTPAPRPRISSGQGARGASGARGTSGQHGPGSNDDGADGR